MEYQKIILISFGNAAQITSKHSSGYQFFPLNASYADSQVLQVCIKIISAQEEHQLPTFYVEHVFEYKLFIHV